MPSGRCTSPPTTPRRRSRPPSQAGPTVLPVPWRSDGSGAVATAVDPGGAPFGLWAVDAPRVGIELVRRARDPDVGPALHDRRQGGTGLLRRTSSGTRTPRTRSSLTKVTFAAGPETVGGIAETGDLPGLLDRPRWVPALPLRGRRRRSRHRADPRRSRSSGGRRPRRSAAPCTSADRSASIRAHRRRAPGTRPGDVPPTT